MNRRPLIALPKGRLLDQSLALLARAGIFPDSWGTDSRKLKFPDTEGRYEFVTLKPVDIPVYVESGTMDAGIVGSDILREIEPDVFEPLDLRIGLCRIVVAARRGMDLNSIDHLQIATKYPHTAGRFFSSHNRHVHVVRLEGSVELAPVLGLAHGIVDLVETGTTLRENELDVVEEISTVSAKLIVNRTAMKTKGAVLQDFIAQLDRVVYAHS
jgi:ATP phosphoribosyltransferase